MTKYKVATTILALSIALTMAANGNNGNISTVSQTEMMIPIIKRFPQHQGGNESIPAFDGGTNSLRVFSRPGARRYPFSEALNSDMMVISEADTECLPMREVRRKQVLWCFQ